MFCVRRFDKIGTGFICEAKRYMRARRYSCHASDVLELIIEEDVWLKFLEHAIFGDSAQEKYFIHFDSPLPQCSDDSFVCRRVPCSYDHCSKPRTVSWVFL